MKEKRVEEMLRLKGADCSEAKKYIISYDNYNTQVNEKDF